MPNQTEIPGVCACGNLYWVPASRIPNGLKSSYRCERPAGHSTKEGYHEAKGPDGYIIRWI